MPLAACTTHSFSTQARLLGDAIHRAGQVRLVSRKKEQAYFAVTAGAEQLGVIVSRSPSDFGILYAACTCGAAAERFPCAHVWASLRTLDESQAKEAKEREEILFRAASLRLSKTFPQDSRAAKAESRDQPRGPSRSQRSAPPTAVPSSPPDAEPRERQSPAESASGIGLDPSLWQRLLPGAATDPGLPARRRLDRFRAAEQPSRLVWYVLNVSASRSTGALCLDLYDRQRGKSGASGRWRPLRIRRDEVFHRPDPEDTWILQLLVGNEAGEEAWPRCGFPDLGRRMDQELSHVTVAPALYDIVLPRIAATERLAWALDDPGAPSESTPITWDPGPPWRFRVRVEAVPEPPCWQLRGELYRDQSVVPLENPVLLLARGLVLFPDSLSRLDAAAEFPWIVCLRQHGAIHVPFADRDAMLARLVHAPAAPEIALSEDLQLATVVGKPLPQLIVKSTVRRGGAPRMVADVVFLYEDLPIRADDARSAVLDTSRQQVVKRDLEAENRHFEALIQLGARPTPADDRIQGELVIDAGRFAEILDLLTADGWSVLWEGRPIRRAGGFHATVTSGIDWFELDGGIDFGGVRAALPRLLQAARQNDRFVRLDDGSCGILDPDWLQRFAGLMPWAEERGGKLQFASCQALLLDALLAGQQNLQTDATFEKLRQRLRSFDGVKPAQPPRGFAGQLREYQCEGLGWLHFLRDLGFGGCLADDMGLGKTVQVLALLESRRRRSVPAGQPRSPSLVVVPKSLIFNWIAEAARFTPRLRVLDYTGQDRARRLAEAGTCDVLLTTYGVLRRDVLALREIEFDYVILDESQAIKNAGSQAAKASRVLRCAHRLAMTGTPVENHLGELWSLFEFLNPGLLGRSAAFQSRAAAEREQGSDLMQTLAAALRPFLLRRTKAQVLAELPEKTEQILHCEMPARQRRLYDELRDYYRASLTRRVDEIGFEKSKIHVLEALLRLRQAACHPGLIDRKRSGEPSGKLDLLLDHVSSVVAEGHKALVFSQFTSLLAIVRQRLDERKLTYAYLDGRTRRRDQVVRRFQEDPQCPLFLISLKAGGQGLNLTSAGYVYILDPWWNPAVEAQAIDRAHRIGQSQHVFAYRLICAGTVEEKILQLQDEKRELAAALMTADNSLIRDLSAADLQHLLS